MFSGVLCKQGAADSTNNILSTAVLWERVEEQMIGAHTLYSVHCTLSNVHEHIHCTLLSVQLDALQQVEAEGNQG